MSDRHSVELPLPYRDLSPNYRGHTKSRARSIAVYRHACMVLYRKARIPRLNPPVTLTIELFLYRPTSFLERYNAAHEYFPLDDDDAIGSFKAGRDALADAGIVPADTRTYVRIGGVIWHTKAPDHEYRRCLVLHLEPAVKLAHHQ